MAKRKAAPLSGQNTTFSISPDGNEITIVARLDGETRISGGGTGGQNLFAGLYGKIPGMDKRISFTVMEKRPEMPSDAQVAMYLAAQGK